MTRLPSRSAPAAETPGVNVPGGVPGTGTRAMPVPAEKLAGPQASSSTLPAGRDSS
jgi:hypothetical protein